MTTEPQARGLSQFAARNPTKTKQDEYAGDNDFELKHILIKSASGGEVDVSDLFVNMSIFEDLFSNTVSAIISFVDMNDICQHLPIIGQQEKMEVVFGIPGDNSGPIKFEFDIFRISVKSISTVSKKQAITCHAVSTQQFKNIHTRISKSYYNTVSGMIKKIFNESFSGDGAGIGKQHKLKVEAKTDSEKRKFIIPNWHPLDAIGWLVDRAVPEENSEACNYIFYQDRNGFHLTTLEKLISATPPVQEYYYMPRRFRESQHGKFRDPGYEMRNIHRIIFQEPGNRLEENLKGMYGAKILTHDIVRKKYEYTTNTLNKNFKKTKHAEAEYPIAKAIDTFSTNPDTFWNFCPIQKTLNMENNLHGGNTVEQNEKYSEWFLKRKSLMRQVGTNIITITVAGDSRRKPGDVVLLNFTPLQPTDGRVPNPNKYINGRYLVTSIKHRLTQEGYLMDMELSKDSNQEAYPSTSNFLKD